MDRVGEMANETAKILLHRAIDALLSEGSLQQRLSATNAYIRKLALYKDKVADELNELKCAAQIFTSSGNHLSPEQELELTERLLTLYIDVSDGALIF
jgi:hypothetical protein